ncbi:hypothetical protein WS46_32550 [Burkholderia sp. RF4-BP95]|nr:hypothetical protein WS46_32550 [Burkholderia sp. RF4-BP95]
MANERAIYWSVWLQAYPVSKVVSMIEGNRRPCRPMLQPYAIVDGSLLKEVALLLSLLTR